MTLQYTKMMMANFTVECLIFARTLLRKFREATLIRQNKTLQI